MSGIGAWCRAGREVGGAMHVGEMKEDIPMGAERRSLGDHRKGVQWAPM